MQHCPWCGRAVQRIEKRYRCWYCFTTSKGYSDFERFNGERLILARESRGLTVDDLARMTDSEIADVVRWEGGSPFIAANTIERLADALDYPVAFFHQEAPKPLGETTLDWHSQVVWCECGEVLGDVGEPLPLICPTCSAVVEGCPRCDGDLLSRERLGKIVSIYCPVCKWQRKEITL